MVRFALCWNMGIRNAVLSVALSVRPLHVQYLNGSLAEAIHF